MRIAYVVTSLGIGGAERQAIAVAKRMAGRDHVVALLVLGPRIAEEWPTTLKVIHLDMRKTPASVVAAVARGRRFLVEFGPDLLHSHGFHANLTARMLRILMPKLTVICSVHNVYEGGRMRMLAYRITDALAQRTTAVCQAAAERFVRLKAVGRGKCAVLLNGIDGVEFAPHPDRRTAARSAMGAESEFVWLTAGRIVPAKDYPNLLRAFARVLEARLDARLWIAGEATGRTAGLMRDLAARLGLKDAVCWLGLRRDLPALLDGADGFVLGSAWEGMPLAVGEAMAMEKVVVATDVGGVRELVGETGALVPAGDSEALAAAMLATMRRSPGDRFAMGRAARERILRNFDIDDRADEWEALYRTVLTEREW
jgi:glycosyltransferase involved in cell wall biosynthesis